MKENRGNLLNQLLAFSQRLRVVPQTNEGANAFKFVQDMNEKKRYIEIITTKYVKD